MGPACDFDGDQICGLTDIDALTAVVVAGSDIPKYDLDRNGEVNQEDRRVWVEDLEKTWFGDANLDGEFNSADFVDVFVAGEYEDDIARNSGWGEGDWDGDQDFTSSDFIKAFTGGGYELGKRPPVAAVPEPSGVLLLALGLALTLAQPRRRLGPQ